MPVKYVKLELKPVEASAMLDAITFYVFRSKGDSKSPKYRAALSAYYNLAETLGVDKRPKTTKT